MVMMRGGLIQRIVPQQSLSDTPAVQRRKRSRKNKFISEVVDVAREGDDPEEVQKEGDDQEEGDDPEEVQTQGDDAGEDANPTEHAHPVADETINEEHAAENAVAQESEHTDAATGLQTPDSNSKNKRKRGPTRMRKVAKDPEDRVKVLFSQVGEHAGSGSVTLSSFLGVLVREHVPVLYNRWDKVDVQTKDTLWEEIQVCAHEIVYAQKMVFFSY